MRRLRVRGEESNFVCGCCSEEEDFDDCRPCFFLPLFPSLVSVVVVGDGSQKVSSFKSERSCTSLLLLLLRMAVVVVVVVCTEERLLIFLLANEQSRMVLAGRPTSRTNHNDTPIRSKAAR